MGQDFLQLREERLLESISNYSYRNSIDMSPSMAIPYPLQHL